MSEFTDEERCADAARRLAEQAQRDDNIRRAQTHEPAADEPFCVICNLQFPAHQTRTPDTPMGESCF